MALRVGIIGLPNAGKSTLLNALARAGAATAPYPFTTIEPNVGVAAVPDERIAAVAGVTHPQRIVPATIEFVDIAGLVRGAHRGEGLGNQFLAKVREVDALAHVVRLFPAPDVPTTESGIDPRRDAEIVDTELLLADLATVERIRERLIPRPRAGDKGAREELDAAEHLRGALQRGISARRAAADGSDGTKRTGIVAGWHLLTAKPVIYVANVGEGEPGESADLQALRDHAAAQDAAVVVVAARWEAELNELDEDDAMQFRAAVLAQDKAYEMPLARLVRAAFSLLGLVTFFSSASAEVRAWPVPRGTTAVEAAGRIHTDMAEGFVRAEVIDWGTLVGAGGLAQARERGLLRLEGRAYQVEDGDVITFRFAA